MEDKVIISLDKFLELNERTKKLDKIHEIAQIHQESGEYVYSPQFDRSVMTSRQCKILILKEDLRAYVNDILGLNGYDLKIIDE